MTPTAADLAWLGEWIDAFEPAPDDTDGDRRERLRAWVAAAQAKAQEEEAVTEVLMSLGANPKDRSWRNQARAALRRARKG